MNLSRRLSAVANMISPGLCVADIGCDHAYLAIHLIRSGTSPHVIAMDINRGPLERARQNVEEAGLSDDIELRLSDGLDKLKPGEAECIVMAGMGGPLMTEIMSRKPEICDNAREFILQPQSDVEKVRRYLEKDGFGIVAEDIVYEDGKFYPMMKAVHGRMDLGKELYYRYGKILLEEKHPVMHKYLENDKKQLEEIRTGLLDSPETEKVSKRLEEITQGIEIVTEALGEYGS